MTTTTTDYVTRRRRARREAGAAGLRLEASHGTYRLTTVDGMIHRAAWGRDTGPGLTLDEVEAMLSGPGFVPLQDPEHFPPGRWVIELNQRHYSVAGVYHLTDWVDRAPDRATWTDMVARLTDADGRPVEDYRPSPYKHHVLWRHFATREEAEAVVAELRQREEIWDLETRIRRGKIAEMQLRELRAEIARKKRE